MSEEERKAIEMLKYIKEHNSLMGFDIAETETNVNYRGKLATQILNLIEKLQKENEESKERIREHTLLISPYYVKENFIPVQKVKDKIEKEIKYHEKNILDIENITMLKGKTAKEEAEMEFNKYAIVVLKKMLQELLEGRK